MKLIFSIIFSDKSIFDDDNDIHMKLQVQKNTHLKILKMSLKRTLSCKWSGKKIEEQLVDQKITINIYVS